MTDELIAISILWGFIFIYAVMATIDFGAGFWSMVYMNRPQTKATKIANRYLSPTWEVTNVFIVAIVVALVSFFPGATFILGTILLIPGSIILLLLTVRSAFLVFSHVAPKYEKVLIYISGISGLLIPAFLISVLPITHGSFVETMNGVSRLRLDRLFTSPHEYAFIAFAITSTLFLSSLLLADYSNEANEAEAYAIYRRDALIIGPFALLSSMLIMITMRNEARWLYDGMMSHWPWLVASVILFLLAGGALFLPPRKKKHGRGIPRLAVVAIVLQYFCASYAYGKAHLPYMIYPNVTIESGFTHPNTFRALFLTYIVGFAILFPGFIYFWRLFMKDRRYVAKDEK